VLIEKAHEHDFTKKEETELPKVTQVVEEEMKMEKDEAAEKPISRKNTKKKNKNKK
jgi:hypothetical protein